MTPPRPRFVEDPWLAPFLPVVERRAAKARALEIIADRAEENNTPPAPDGNADAADENDDEVKFLPESEFFSVRL